MRKIQTGRSMAAGTQQQRKRARRGASTRSGQAIVLFAVVSVGLLGLVGLAIDGGQALLNRRAMQASADSAAEASAHMLAANFRTTGSPASGLYSDTDISKVVCDTATGSQSGGSPGLTCATDVTAYYTDASGQRVAGPVAVGGGSIPSAAHGVEVTSRDPAHSTRFVQLVGFKTAQEAAKGTSTFSAVQSVDVTQPNSGPWVVWFKTCNNGVEGAWIKIGDDVVFRSNQFAADAACGDPAWGINGNGFKGFLKFEDDCNGHPNVYQQGDACSSSGNALGQEPTQNVVNAYNNQTPLYLPVIDSSYKQSGVNHFHIVGFVAIIPDSANTNPSSPWTGKIVGYSAKLPNSGCPEGQSCGTPPTYTPLSIGLAG
ncbi:MAG: hypothetical protein E6J14_11385 [Chloroflexi bacterium]|nr:MAG: hypothetical protein E6J14_11385 [Chloroflexota bacterium]